MPMAILAAVMVICLVGGACEAWRGHFGRCLLLMAVGIVIAGYVVLQGFVPGGHR